MLCARAIVSILGLLKRILLGQVNGRRIKDFCKVQENREKLLRLKNLEGSTSEPAFMKDIDDLFVNSVS